MILATQKGHSDIISALMDANADANIAEKVNYNNVHNQCITINGYYVYIDLWLECSVFRSKVGESQHCPAVDFQRSFSRARG